MTTGQLEIAMFLKATMCTTIHAGAGATITPVTNARYAALLDGSALPAMINVRRYPARAARTPTRARRAAIAVSMDGETGD